MIKTYIVYRTVNDLTQQYYVGVHGQVKDDNYLGSGIRLKAQINKYGKENFSRSTLATFHTEAEAFTYEKEVLKELLHDPQCLNLSPGGDGGANFKGRFHSDETKARMAAHFTGRVPSDATRAKLSAANKRRSPETQRRIADEVMARRQHGDLELFRHSDETKKALSERLKGMTPWNKKLPCGHIFRDKCAC